MTFRNLALRLHGFIGTVMGLLLVVSSLTGASIVFREELDHALHRSLQSATPQAEQVSIDTILTPVQAAHPSLPLQFVMFPRKPDETYLVAMKEPNGHRLETFVNPYTGAVLGERVWERSPIGFLYSLHEELLSGTGGMVVIGIAGLSLLLTALTGIILWAGWRRLANGFRIRWHAPTALVSFDLHNVGGIISAVFLLVLSATGIVIVALHVLPALSTPPAVKSAPQPSSLALSELLRRADAAIPEGKTTMMVFLETEPQTVSIHKKLPNQETGRFDLSSVEIDRASGKVLQTNRVVKPEGFFKVIITIADLHFGTFGGLATRVLYVFMGLMPTILLITGLITWKRRRGLLARRNAELQIAQQAQVNPLP
ncbi:MAG: PepSY domain-containing protein [Stenomitos rutilans HA7619-LM2]|jgi:uncharacterized iron-regulated membrane protein|nr:PepSY domain-containing protein [Stenomitos rutilans HA7619-LM2]